MFTVRGFLKAAANGDTATITRYIERGGYVDARDGEGDTALHLAAENGHEDVIRQLVKAGLRIEEKNKKGYTPLGTAILYDQPRALKELLENGADPNAAQEFSFSPLSLAVSRHHNSCLKMLLEAKADIMTGALVSRAVENRNYDAAEVLVEAGAECDAPGSSNYRATHHAAMNGADKLMKKLLEKGVDIDAQGYGGDTPLHLAINHGHANIVALLLANGARIDIENQNDYDAPKAAQHRGNKEIMRLIDPLVKETIAKSTTALTASADAMPEGDKEEWVRLGMHQVARVGVYPALSRRLTEIFNFESRERMIICENLKTGAENVTPPASFDTTADAALKQALAMFRERGGKADEEAVFGARLAKKTLKPAEF
jgi:ankyrin repeat protein